MKVDAVKSSPNFGANLSKNVLPLIAHAKGSCPLHEKPLLYDAIKTIQTLFPENVISRNDNKIYISRGNFYTKSISDIKGRAVDDVRSIAMSLEYLKIGLNAYSKPTSKQKIELEKFKNKWSAFATRRNG